jgi:hypothetical protein
VVKISMLEEYKKGSNKRGILSIKLVDLQDEWTGKNVSF